MNALSRKRRELKRLKARLVQQDRLCEREGCDLDEDAGANCCFRVKAWLRHNIARLTEQVAA